MSEPVERQTSTFTWISMLSAVSIMALLLGMLAVSVNDARESARKNSCNCHGKQIAMGIHGFHDTYNYIPPARLERRIRVNRGEPASTKIPRAEIGPNWLVLASQFFANQGTYEAFDVQLKELTTPTEQEGNEQHSESPLWNIDATLPDGRLARGPFDHKNAGPKGPLMRCPAETSPEIPYAGFGGGWGRGSYAINAGPCELMAGPDSAPCKLAGGKSPWGLKAAGIAGVNWGVTLRELTQQDGTSKTILFSEVRFGTSPDDLRGTWALGLPGASILANSAVPFADMPNSMHPKSDRIPDCDKVQKAAGGSAALGRLGMGCDPQATAAEQTAARSLHVGGVNVSFCDGSGRFISNKIAPRIWFLMLSRNDGEAVPYNDDFQ